MQSIRSVTAALLTGAVVVALALGVAAVAHADEPTTNRGWTTPVGTADQFADQSSGED